MPLEEKERLIRAFARAIADLSGYIPGPDMGTNEVCMAWVRDEIGRAVGLPRVIGGIPLDEIGATGLGVAVAAEVAEKFSDINLATALVLRSRDMARWEDTPPAFCTRRAPASSPSPILRGTALCAEGFDLSRLNALKDAGESVTEYPGAEVAERDAIVSAPCDILIPAARPDIIDSSNADAIRARLIVQGANIPATAQAEAALHARGVLVIPDFIANAGGVICASVEYRGGTESQALAIVAEKIRQNTQEVLSRSRDQGVLPRDAANALAETRLRKAMALRRTF